MIQSHLPFDVNVNPDLSINAKLELLTKYWIITSNSNSRNAYLPYHGVKWYMLWTSIHQDILSLIIQVESPLVVVTIGNYKHYANNQDMSYNLVDYGLHLTLFQS